MRKRRNDSVLKCTQIINVEIFWFFKSLGGLIYGIIKSRNFLGGNSVESTIVAAGMRLKTAILSLVDCSLDSLYGLKQ